MIKQLKVLFLLHLFQLFSVRQMLKQINRKSTTIRLLSSGSDHVLIEMTVSCSISVMQPVTFGSVEQF